MNDILNDILFWEYQNGPIHLIGWHLYYLIVLFSLLTWVLGRFFFRPLLGTIEQREEKIGGARRTRREASREVEEKLEAYQKGIQSVRREAYSVREEAQREAQRAGDEKLEGVRNRVQEKVSTAESDLEAQIQKARRELEEEAKELGRGIAFRILGREEAGA